MGVARSQVLPDEVILHRDTTNHSIEAANNLEHTIAVYQLPANSLASNNDGIYIRAVLTTSANSASRHFVVRFDGQVVGGATGNITGSDEIIVIEAWIYRTAVGTQRIINKTSYGPAQTILLDTSDKNTGNVIAGNHDETAALDIDVRVQQTGSPVANDIVLRAFDVKKLSKP